MVTAVAAPVASADPWQCSAFGYLFQTPAAGQHDLIQLDLVSGEDTVIANPPESINAAGYNVLDDFMYGIQIVENPGIPLTFSNQFVRVHSDGSVDELGFPAGMTNNATHSYPVGEVDANGRWWGGFQIPGGGGSFQWYQVDLTTPTPTLLSQGTLLPSGTAGNPADWAWVNGAFYGIAPSSPAGGDARLVSFTPGATTWTDHGPLPVVGSSAGFGAAFVDAAGFLYGSRNADGFIFRVNPVTRQTILVTDEGPPSGGNDGARCAAAPIPTITVTKTVNGRVRAADQFTVGLQGPGGGQLTSATTSGTGTTASTTNWPVSQGETYTITDAMATGSPTPLGEYAKSIACTDAGGNPVATGGTGPTWTLMIANATDYACNVTNQAVADVVLEKSAAPSPIVPGEDVTFSLKVTNNGPSTAVGETVADQLPAEVTFSSASAGCSEASGTVTCAAGDLAPGASQTFTITGRVASDLDQCLRNTATASGSTFDPDTSNNSSTICSQIEGESDVSITKAASTATVASGGQVMYTLVVENDGPSDDPSVTVTDPLPAGLALVSANPSQGSCTTTDNVASCDLGALKDGGSAQVLVTADATGTGCITNTAFVRGAHEDPDAEDNQASAQVCVEQRADPVFDLDVDKRASANRPRIGQRTTYRIVVANKGPDAAPAAKVTDTYNARAKVVSVATTAGSCTDEMPITCELGRIEPGDSVTVTVVIRPREIGPARNAASATSCCGRDGTPGNNMDTADTRVRKVPLRISKVSSRSSVRAGETLTYRIRVRNPSRGVARRVRVCDRPGSGLRFVSSKPRAKRSGIQRCWTIKRLGPRKSKTFRVTVRVARGANGRLTNRATVRSRDARNARARARIRVLGVATPVTG